jgi:hypothetical protein
LAAELERELGTAVECLPGSVGQFDVELDGEVVSSRGGGYWSRLFGGGWPESSDVVAAIRRRQALAANTAAD